MVHHSPPPPFKKKKLLLNAHRSSLGVRVLCTQSLSLHCPAHCPLPLRLHSSHLRGFIFIFKEGQGTAFSTFTFFSSLALCPQAMSQAPQHFRSFEMQAACDGCFAIQSVCSVACSPRCAMCFEVGLCLFHTICRCFVVQAVYFYQPDGRGPCLAFEGEKLQLHWFRGYLIVVSREGKSMPRAPPM